MKNQICMKCGEAAWKQNLCKNHFIESQNLFDVKNFSVIVCRNCGSAYYGKWTKSLEDVIETVVKNITGEKIKTYTSVKLKGNAAIVKVTATGKITGLLKKEEKMFTVLIKRKLCENCIKISGGYHEALLQIRGDNADKILDEIQDNIESKDVVSAQKIKNGYDIKILTKGVARKTVRVLEDCTIKKSYKHVTTKKGRMIFRDFYAIR